MPDGPPRARVLVVDDDESVREGCRGILSAEGYQVRTAENVPSVLQDDARGSFDVILLDLWLPGIGGIEAIAALREKEPDAVITVITGFPTISTAVEAMKEGAFDYIPKPFTPDQLLFHVERAAKKRAEDAQVETMRRSLRWKEEDIDIIARSEAMKRALGLVEKAAPTDCTVLLSGESGTGKEVMARHIHKLSARSGRELVAVDCSALVENLIEAELFGHVKGAFTGAWRTTRGLLELADRGTFFFDEVSSLGLSVQSKLLRTLQEREVRRIGDTRPIPVDVRIIAATNRNLREGVSGGTFREDLFFRLNVFPVLLPPLRERKEDVLEIATRFLDVFSKKEGKRIAGFRGDAVDFILGYPWPGNVRELRHAVERAVIIEEGPEIRVESMLVEPAPCRPAPGVSPSQGKGGAPAEEGDSLLLAEAEARHIRRVLDAAGGNKAKTARLLGIDKKTLNAKIRRYGIKA